MGLGIKENIHFMIGKTMSESVNGKFRILYINQANYLPDTYANKSRWYKLAHGNAKHQNVSINLNPSWPETHDIAVARLPKMIVSNRIVYEV